MSRTMDEQEARYLRLEKIEDAARALCEHLAMHGRRNLAHALQVLRDALSFPQGEKPRRPRRGSVIAQLLEEEGEAGSPGLKLTH